MNPDLQFSPLHEEHQRLGARLIEFGGWMLPVQFSGITDEHLAVRNAVGVFDISHMGEFLVSGPGAADWLNQMLTNDIRRLEPGHGQYTFLLNEAGGIIDDLIVYQLSAEEFLMVVNAACIEIDAAWLLARVPSVGVEFKNSSSEFAGVAVQGPECAVLFDKIFGQGHARPARNEISRITCHGSEILLARTGYTGEDGFEAFFPAESAKTIWNCLLDAGTELGLKPCGLGARDTLRLEMCYPLNGSDLSQQRTPLEAGLSIFVDLNKEAFTGREVLIAQKKEGIIHRLTPFRMVEKSPPPRAHYPVFHQGAHVGEVSSGTLSPSLNEGIGMAYLPSSIARINERIEIEIRGRKYGAVIDKKPLLRKN